MSPHVGRRYIHTMHIHDTRECYITGVLHAQLATWISNTMCLRFVCIYTLDVPDVSASYYVYC